MPGYTVFSLKSHWVFWIIWCSWHLLSWSIIVKLMLSWVIAILNLTQRVSRSYEALTRNHLLTWLIRNRISTDEIVKMLVECVCVLICKRHSRGWIVVVLHNINRWLFLLHLSMRNIFLHNSIFLFTCERSLVLHFTLSYIWSIRVNIVRVHSLVVNVIRSSCWYNFLLNRHVSGLWLQLKALIFWGT